MKPMIRTPFFEVGIKNYLFGERVLELAKAADAAAEKYDVDVLMITPYTEIARVAQQTRRLIILAPYMDVLHPGRGMADVLPEAIQAAGAKGVVLNHCERPMTLNAIYRTLRRADELGLLTFACADSIAEAKAIAQLHPDLLNPEPSDWIGGTQGVDLGFAAASAKAIKEIDPSILVEQAAGVVNGEQVRKLVLAGAEGIGVSSGICTAANPEATLADMVRNVSLARAALQNDSKEMVK